MQEATTDKRDLLLVTDMQNVYCKGEKWECLDTEGVSKRLIEIIETGKTDVIFTKFIADDNPKGRWKLYNEHYKDVNENTYLNAIVDDLKPYSTRYPIYSKHTYSSLSIREVRKAAKRCRRVVVGGVIAECCVLFTVFSLIDLGCEVVYLTDGVSGLTKEKEDASIMTLVGLDPLHVHLMTCKEYLESIK